ncbi:MAG: preprotein translocase subunit TatA [Sulfuricurvum sp. PC08-66]|nr:MAG: preprotein translocase subunit TatA [Sulfuricurvum sp. PC08-66]
MGMPSATELLIILGIVVIIFGGKKIPELMKGIGTGIKNFKTAVKDEEVATPTDTKKVENTTPTNTTAAPKDSVKQA